MIKLGIKPLTKEGLNTYILVVLQDSLPNYFESNLCSGLIFFLLLSKPNYISQRQKYHSKYNLTNKNS